MEGRVVPYLKEVGLAGNHPGQLYVAAYLYAFVLYSSRSHILSARAYLDS